MAVVAVDAAIALVASWSNACFGLAEGRDLSIALVASWSNACKHTLPCLPIGHWRTYFLRAVCAAFAARLSIMEMFLPIDRTFANAFLVHHWRHMRNTGFDYGVVFAY